MNQAVMQGDDQMSVEENMAIAQRHSEVYWNEGRLDLASELHANDIVFHDADSPPLRGTEAYDQFAIMYRTAFPDLHFTTEEMLGAGDLVATRWTCTATHQGELMGIPPTGKQITITGIDIFRVVDGKIVEEWVNWSTLSMLQQLGVIPPLGEGGE
jgi:steroid delta-isomerase-like uncharacterized protein